MQCVHKAATARSPAAEPSAARPLISGRAMSRHDKTNAQLLGAPGPDTPNDPTQLTSKPTHATHHTTNTSHYYCHNLPPYLCPHSLELVPSSPQLHLHQRHATVHPPAYHCQPGSQDAVTCKVQQGWRETAPYSTIHEHKNEIYTHKTGCMNYGAQTARVSPSLPAPPPLISPPCLHSPSKDSCIL